MFVAVYRCACISLCVMYGILNATPYVKDPGIPHGETTEYFLFVNKQEYIISEKCLVSIVDGKKKYVIESRSSVETALSTIDAATLFASSVDIVTGAQNAKARSRTDFVSDFNTYQPDEMGIIEFHNVPYLMRGFSAPKNTALKIRLLSDATPFPMIAHYIGDESIVVQGKTYMCYKMQFGLSGFLKPFFPPATFWYAKEAPHYLVRFDGLTSGPGSPRRIIELKSRKIVPQ